MVLVAGVVLDICIYGKVLLLSSRSIDPDLVNHSVAKQTDCRDKLTINS